MVGPSHVVPDVGGGGPYGPSSSILPGDLTPQAFAGDLVELGWKGRFQYDHPQVVQLRVSPSEWPLESLRSIPAAELLSLSMRIVCLSACCLSCPRW
jgi:hypothetical protein